MTKFLRNNTLTAVPGVFVGHHTSISESCGVTVVLCPEGAIAGVDVRGAAPGTRETDLLSPVNLVEKVHSIVLTGGSVYGLSTADGVVRWLADRNIGFPLPDNHVAPIVPAACLYDLGRGQQFIPDINALWGSAACTHATSDSVELGCVGAGTGAMAGPLKGGLGSASELLDHGIIVSALVAVNSLGSVVDMQTGKIWESRCEINNEFGSLAHQSVKIPFVPPSEPARNTTIGVVATNAVLSKPQAQKLAQMAHDGLARAIRPSHTMFDGDTIFSLSTGQIPLPSADGFFPAPFAQSFNELGRAAADCFTRAIIHALLSATSTPYATSFRDLFL